MRRLDYYEAVLAGFQQGDIFFVVMDDDDTFDPAKGQGTMYICARCR